MFYNTALQNRLAGLKKNSKDIKVKDESSIFHLKGKYFFNIFCKIFEEEKTFSKKQEQEQRHRPQKNRLFPKDPNNFFTIKYYYLGKNKFTKIIF